MKAVRSLDGLFAAEARRRAEMLAASDLCEERGFPGAAALLRHAAGGGTRMVVYSAAGTTLAEGRLPDSPRDDGRLAVGLEVVAAGQPAGFELRGVAGETLVRGSAGVRGVHAADLNFDHALVAGGRAEVVLDFGWR